MAASDLEQELEAKLRQARDAMESPEQKARLASEEARAAARRREAMLAMEGIEHRKLREQREKAIRELELSQKVAVETATRAKEDEAKRQAAIAAQKEKEKMEAQKATTDRNAKIQKSEAIIEQIKANAGAMVSPIRTLKADLARAAKSEQLSAASIMMKEQKAGTYVPEADPSGSGRKFALIAIILVLIAGGAAGLYAGFNQYQKVNTPVNVPATVIQSLVFADQAVELPLTTAGFQDTIAKTEAAAQPNTLTNLYAVDPTTDQTAANPTRRLANFDKVAAAAGANISDSLTRFFDQPFMFGTYQNGTGSNRFLIIKTKFFENTSAELYRTESDLPAEFAPLLGNSGTTTPVFKDLIIKNQDTRVVRDSAGQIMWLYSFLDRQTLVFARDELTFDEIVKRFNTPQPTTTH